MKDRVGFAPMPQGSYNKETGELQTASIATALLLISLIAGANKEQARDLAQNDQVQQLLRLLLGAKYAVLKAEDDDIVYNAVRAMAVVSADIKFYKGITFEFLRPLNVGARLAVAAPLAQNVGSAP